MAIVKMKQFELLILKEDLDKTLLELQRFNEVSFFRNEDVFMGFEVCQPDYDFEDNIIKQTHIKNTLNSLKQYRKKLSVRGQKMKDIGLKERSFNELFTDDIESLDILLDRYDEYYEASMPELLEYKHYIPWQHKSYNIEYLKELQLDTIQVGTYENKYTDKVIHALKQMPDVFYIIKETKEYSILLLLSTVKDKEELDILYNSYDIEPRSILSLHVEDISDDMLELLNNYIYKREHYLDQMDALQLDQEKLEIHYERLKHEYKREMAKSMMLVSEMTCFITGWISEIAEDQFISVIKEATNNTYELEISDASLHNTEVPILLKNNKVVEAFEPITTMYAMPRYDELDPTPLFAPFYAFFFGMMLADLGYGLIMIVVMLLALKFVKMKPQTEKLVRLLAIMGFTTAFWGVIYGSFFGGIVPMTPVIDINKDFTFVLVLALGLGIIHLLIALCIRGYIYARDYKKRYILYDVVFWMMTLLGSAVLVTGMFSDIFSDYNQIAGIVAIVGAVGIVLTNGREAKTIPGKFAAGLYSLYGFTNYVGDVISYSRLMALGLAGASIGMAFNLMVSMVSSMGVLGIVLGIVIFIIGHTFNVLINGLSAYVHSARLTYVEFFGKFYTGGGKAFKSFRDEPTYIQLKEEYNGLDN